MELANSPYVQLNQTIMVSHYKISLIILRAYFTLGLPVSASNETFIYQLVYLNRAPFTTMREYNITTNEDVDSEAYVNKTRNQC